MHMSCYICHSCNKAYKKQQANKSYSQFVIHLHQLEVFARQLREDIALEKTRVSKERKF